MTGRVQLLAALAAGVLTVASLGAVAVAGSASAAQSPDGPRPRIVGGTIAHTADTPWAIQLSNSGSPDATGAWIPSGRTEGPGRVARSLSVLLPRIPVAGLTRPELIQAPSQTARRITP